MFGLNWFGKEKNQTEHGQFEPVFSSIRFKNLKKNNFGLIAFFGPKPDRTEIAQPYF